MAYGECWELQRSLFDAMCQKKRDKSFSDEDAAGTILLVEHPAVYTLGKSGNEENMLCTEAYIKSLGAEFYHIDRGGDITFAGLPRSGKTSTTRLLKTTSSSWTTSTLTV